MTSTDITGGQKAHILAEALPYLRSFHGKTIVVLYGGVAMADTAMKAAFGRDVALLQLVGIHPVIVHGGGAKITELLLQMGLPDRFYSGMRVTDDQTLHVVEMVLSEVNQEIVGLINRHGGRAVGLDGQDGRFIRARRMNTREESVTSDVGLVGDIVSIDPELIDLLQSREFIPVVMAVGAGVEGEAYSVDAGVLAGKLAEALNAEMLILMTDAQGVVDGSHRLVSSISASGIEALLADGVIAGEMAVHAVVVAGAVRHGVKSAHIIDARIPNALLLEVLTSEGMGTMIASDEGLHFLTDSREYLAPR